MDNVNSKMDNVNSKMDNVNSKMDNVNSKMDNVNSKMDNVDSKMDNVNSKMDNVNSKIEEFNLDMNTNFSDLKLSCNLLDQNINIKTANINNTLEIITNSITNVSNVTSSILEKVSLFKNCDCSCCCSNDCNCNCDFYNALFSSSIITKINNYVSTYIETIHQDTDTYIPIDIFHNLNIELISLENLFVSDPSCCFFNIIDIYRNMIKIVKTAYDNKNLAKSTLKTSESWKNDSEILNDRDKLNEYIQNLSKNMFVTSVDVNSVYANLKPQYQTYIQLYGLPENLDFDIDKLSSILKEIGDY
jgi:septation ring formation regulator EzrA